LLVNFDIYRNIQQSNSILIIHLDSLSQLEGTPSVCSQDNGYFHCTRSDGTFMDWRLTSTCGSLDYRISFSSSSSDGDSRVESLCSATLNFTVTSRTSSFISVTLTIHRPVQWADSDIGCIF